MVEIPIPAIVLATYPADLVRGHIRDQGLPLLPVHGIECPLIRRLEQPLPFSRARVLRLRQFRLRSHQLIVGMALVDGIDAVGEPDGTGSIALDHRVELDAPQQIVMTDPLQQFQVIVMPQPSRSNTTTPPSRIRVIQPTGMFDEGPVDDGLHLRRITQRHLPFHHLFQSESLDGIADVHQVFGHGIVELRPALPVHKSTGHQMLPVVARELHGRHLGQRLLLVSQAITGCQQVLVQLQQQMLERMLLPQRRVLQLGQIAIGIGQHAVFLVIQGRRQHPQGRLARTEGQQGARP